MLLNETLGELLRRTREEGSGKREEDAKKLRITPSYLSMIESGERNPSDKLLRAFSDYYGLSIDVLESKRSRGRRSKLKSMNSGDFLNRFNLSMLQLQQWVFSTDGLTEGLEVKDDIQGNPAQWAAISNEYPDMMVLIIDTNIKNDPLMSIVGYWQIVPVLEQVYSDICSGQILDADFSLHMLEPALIPHCSYLFYAVAVMLDKKRCREFYTESRSKLFISFVHTLDHFASIENPFFIRQLCAVPDTKDGEVACSVIGLLPNGYSQKITKKPIFTGNYDCFTKDNRIFNDKFSLGSKYKEHFEKK